MVLFYVSCIVRGRAVQIALGSFFCGSESRHASHPAVSLEEECRQRRSSNGISTSMCAMISKTGDVKHFWQLAVLHN